MRWESELTTKSRDGILGMIEFHKGNAESSRAAGDISGANVSLRIVAKCEEELRRRG